MAGYIINHEALDHTKLTEAPQVARDAGNKALRLLDAIVSGLSKVAFRRGNNPYCGMAETIATFPFSNDLSRREQIRLNAHLTGVSSAETC